MASAAGKEALMASLLSSLSQVPPTAIPPMLDCILISTNLSPLSLFTCLLDSFSDLTNEHGQLDSNKNVYVASLVSSVCHLLKKIGKDDSSLKLFISRCFIPLSRMVNENGLEILNQAAESLFNVANDTNTWEVVEEKLVPAFLRSIGFSMGMFQNEESDVYEWSRFSVFLGSDKHINDTGSDKESLTFQNGSIPLSISCHILASVLNAALQHQQTTGTSESILPNDCLQVNNFAANLLGDLCSLTLQMLSQSSKHRTCAIQFLLPTIFNVFISCQYSENSFHKQKYILSRKDFSMRVWKCCRTLLAVGTVERRDAYNALSLYLSYFPPHGGYEHASLGNTAGEFDIGGEKELWDQIKKGLVDKEGFVRKQSLHILKTLLLTKEGNPCHPNVREKITHDKKSMSKGMTKRGLWAEKEAKSMGVGKINNLNEPFLPSKQKWEAFILLYETLEEYGTHLVEAAWNYQITLLIHSSGKNLSSISEGANQNQIEIPGSGKFSDWLTILWERGFCHDNPHVRCLIMQSFLEMEWTNHEDVVKSLPESFVLGPFIQGLNDPVHHKDFGAKGIYTSRTIEGAAKFVQQFTYYFNKREHLAFLSNLASIVKKQSFGRSGLMGLVECISSVACGLQVSKIGEVGWNVDAVADGVLSSEENSLRTSIADLVDVLRFIIESSRQHFNPNYRLRVCERVLEAAASTTCTFDLPLGTLLLFISVFPREFTDTCGSLRAKLLEWLSGCCRKSLCTNCCSNKMMLLNNLYDFSTKFISHHSPFSGFMSYDDDDLEAWHLEAKRWARLLFLVIREEDHLEPLLMFIQNRARNLCQQIDDMEQHPMRFLVLILSLVEELQMTCERFYFGRSIRKMTDLGLCEMLVLPDSAEAYNVMEKFSKCLGTILVELVSFANLSCLVFWDFTIIKDMTLPLSIKGKLGGPSQRRLSSSATSTVLQAIASTKTVSSVLSFCTQFDHRHSLDSAVTFLWKFFWNVVSSSSCSSKIGAEIGLAACESLVPALKALASVFSPFAVYILKENQLPTESEGCAPLLDSLVVTFIQYINSLLTFGELARSRQAVLIDWKWLCLESLLSVPFYALENGMTDAFFLDSTNRLVFCDLVESLENAGEGSVLPMLRSLRLLFGLFSSGRLVSSRDHIDAQMMWSLVHSSWIMHVSCNKRRIAPISALLSSVLHPSTFRDESFHFLGNESGPLKWFIGKILEEGTKSPRTIRLAALHLTGLWLLHPRIIKYYINELIQISLHGSVAFDEDFEAELSENNDAKSEVSLLAKSVDPELTEVFINTELYARVSVAVLFSKLADMADSVGSGNENEDCLAALESGKLFLLELLDFVVNNLDLRKELYKKYSAIHRRKARAWQMLCVLSRFVKNDIVQQVTHDLHLCLYRNNLPSVRQYLETFAINLYLRFPSLVAEQLGPILRDHDMRPQALSSYVFITANVILHAPREVQSWHLNELLPPIIPLLTSHHHSLRGFTQLLVYQVLCKQSLTSDSHVPKTVPLEKRCFEDLKLYLSKNSDCTRLRASMEGYLDEFDPKMSVSPAGIFTSRVEVQEFECVPRSLMEQVLDFLNDARDDLRCSMAKDAMTIKNESLSGSSEISEGSARGDIQPNESHNDLALDFQKKINLTKHESHTVFGSWRDTEVYKPFSEMEKEDQLLDQVLQLRSVAMERIRASQQPLILVASLIDRIPNLAGLARTCEVFKASALAIADTNVLHDKQFQLISVTAEKWVPIVEVPVNSMKIFLDKKKKEGFSILGLEQTANSVPLDQYTFPQKTLIVLGREKEGIPADIIHILDACIEIPQLGVVRSLNVHVSGAIALWEYTRQQRLH